ncbi:MAG: metal-dependent transcriptional regulator [Candidatus Bathyarchaeota archaeon]
MSGSDEISEHLAEYLEALWYFEEHGLLPAKIKDIAESLKFKPPSVVEMLKKLAERNYVEYIDRKGAKLTPKGRKAITQIIRNHRLIEVLLKDTLHEELDENAVCGLEHHMTENIANALCTLLKHPSKCPHGRPIPKGKCDQ